MQISIFYSSSLLQICFIVIALYLFYSKTTQTSSYFNVQKYIWIFFFTTHSLLLICIKILFIVYCLLYIFFSFERQLCFIQCEDDLRWHARQSDVDKYRTRLIEDDVLIIYDRYIVKIKELFKSWSRKGKMSLRQWKQMIDILLIEETSTRLGTVSK